VTIPDSVTSIGERAFSRCSGLASVVIPDSVITIGTYAFNDCDGLTSVTIPDSVITIGEGAFFICSGLRSVVIGSGVTTIGENAFYDTSYSLIGAYFKGDAPSLESSLFNVGYNPNITVYRLTGASGWPDVPTEWGGCVTALWDGTLADADYDGLPDSWEQIYFEGISVDSDNICSNGINTVLEAYIAGLDPTNVASIFEVTSQRTASGTELTWSGISNRLYYVLFSTNLLNDFTAIAFDLKVPQNHYTDTNSTDRINGYYKVEVGME
jgi:hypothetical protein